PVIDGAVADAHLLDHPDPLERTYAVHDRAVRDQAAGLVHLVEVELVSTEPARAGHGALLHHRGGRHGGGGLGGEAGRRPALADGLPEDLLTPPETAGLGGVGDGYAMPEGLRGNGGHLEAVDLGGVEEGDSEFERTTDDGARLLPSVPVAVAPLPGPKLAS